MNKSEMKKALSIAKSDKDLQDFPNCMIGCALPDFTPCNVTLEAVASLIRYQASYMVGGWDLDEINNIAKIGQKRFIIVG